MARDDRDPTKPIEVIEGSFFDLGNGTELGVSKVSYAHLKDDDNESDCVATLRAGDRLEEVPLSRTHSQPPEPVEVMGWRLALEGVAAYQRPGRAWIYAERLP